MKDNEYYCIVGWEDNKPKPINGSIIISKDKKLIETKARQINNKLDYLEVTVGTTTKTSYQVLERLCKKQLLEVKTRKATVLT